MPMIMGTGKTSGYDNTMSERVNVNGRITPPAAAAVSPLDRGFLFGDGVYETVRTYHGRPFRLGPHVDRLRRSADRIGIPWLLPSLDPAAEVARTLTEAANPESSIRIILTRGVGPVGYDTEGCGDPTLVVHVRPCPPLPPHARDEGVDIAVVGVQRNSRAAIDPAIKSGNLLNNFLAWREGRRLGVFEPILLNPDGRVAEGASSNIFIVAEGRVLTPPPAEGLLEGITRGLVLELARGAGLSIAEESFGPDRLRAADEAFLTSTLKGVLPVRRCDGWPIRHGRPGPLTLRLTDLYDALVEAETNRGSDPGSIRR
jgi:branched-chain amino acid aminotransferase